jgi:hypothetical protein
LIHNAKQESLSGVVFEGDGAKPSMFRRVMRCAHRKAYVQTNLEVGRRSMAAQIAVHGNLSWPIECEKSKWSKSLNDKPALLRLAAANPCKLLSSKVDTLIEREQFRTSRSFRIGLLPTCGYTASEVIQYLGLNPCDASGRKI